MALPRLELRPERTTWADHPTPCVARREWQWRQPWRFPCAL